MRILFRCTHTLYLKVLIPVMVELHRRGASITLQKNRPNLFGYSPARFGGKPTQNRCVNRDALRHVADLIGYGEDAEHLLRTIRDPFFPRVAAYDAVVGTTKNQSQLIAARQQGARQAYAIGYQHNPILLSLGAPLTDSAEQSLQHDVFFGDNPYANLHGFRHAVEDAHVTAFRFVNFTYLERAFSQYGPPTAAKDTESGRPYGLVFHPGGYRDVLTPSGADRASSHARQREFLLRICRPMLDAGLTPVIKTHPLPAQHHGYADVCAIRDRLSASDPAFERVIVTADPYWPYAFQSRMILTFGSSGLYELFAAGVSRVWVCGFFGPARSDKFSMFDDLYLPTEESYQSLLLTTGALEKNLAARSGLTQHIFQAYATLPAQGATKYIADQILATT